MQAPPALHRSAYSGTMDPRKEGFVLHYLDALWIGTRVGSGSWYRRDCGDILLNLVVLRSDKYMLSAENT